MHWPYRTACAGFFGRENETAIVDSCFVGNVALFDSGGRSIRCEVRLMRALPWRGREFHRQRIPHARGTDQRISIPPDQGLQRGSPEECDDVADGGNPVGSGYARLGGVLRRAGRDAWLIEAGACNRGGGPEDRRGGAMRFLSSARLQGHERVPAAGAAEVSLPRQAAERFPGRFAYQR